jgi:hypothetical protein
MTSVVALSILLLCTPAASAQQMPLDEVPPLEPVPAATQARLSRLVPGPAPAGATPLGPPAFYSSSRLFEYMDGAADAFQGYDVVALFHSEYKAGAIGVTVDIFDMGTPENAFGMYATERSPSYDFVAAGAEGYRDEGILNFFQDRYYVRLAAFGAGADATLQQFAAAISEGIGTAKSFPAALSKLPQAQRKARTERYLLREPLGHPFLGPAFQAVYRLDGGDCTLMLSVAASVEDARSRLESLEAHFRRTGQWDPAPEFGSGAARGSKSVEGALVAAARGRYVVILLSPSAGSATFFKDVGLQVQ